jgi:hypothetical protein
MARITHVAIRFQGTTYALPAPNRHHDVIRYIVETAGVETVDVHDDDQGFLDESGHYLTRRQALRIAQQEKQLLERAIGPKLGWLYSEDVW